MALEQRLVYREAGVLAFPQLPPFNSLFIDEPDEIFANTIAAISAFLLMEIIGGAARGHFGHQFRRALHVIVCAAAALSTGLRQDAQKNVWLRLIVQIQPHR